MGTSKKSKQINFAFIKATEGDDHLDTQFQKNWQETKNIDLPRGAYHFYSLRINGQDQANHFIKTVPKEPGSLPPVVDLEFGGNSQVRPSKEEFNKELTIFLSALEEHYQQLPIIYTTSDFYEQYLKGINSLDRYPLWIRNIFKEPKPIEGKNWLFWQYHSKAKVTGIEGNVDLNVFAGNENAWQKFLDNNTK